MHMQPLPLSRTCNLRDFPQCPTVAMWQQQLALEAWTRWIDMQHLRLREGGLVVNYGPNGFRSPGPTEVAPPGAIPAVFGINVLDHVAAPVSFLTHAAQLLRPEGLLFLTMAYWDAEGPDTALGHQDRTRIYSRHSTERLLRDARRVGYGIFGEIDWTYHGDVLGDHSVASLVLYKRGGTT